jgi:hypothetical protein
MTMEVPAPDRRMMHIAFDFAYSDYGIAVPGRPWQLSSALLRPLTDAILFTG